SMLERENLSGLNYNDWFRSPKMNAVYDTHNEVACLILESMTPELHGKLKNSSPYEMLQELKSMFEKQAGNYVAQLERLDYVIPRDLSVGLIMNGLTSDFAGFAATPQVWRFNVVESREPIRNRLILKGRVKARERIKVISLSLKTLNLLLKEHPTKDDTCHHYKEVGHCKRNCPAYLAELIKKKKQVSTASSSDIFVIELFSFPTKSWVYDTSCGTHICNTKHDFRGVRNLKQIEAIGSFDFVLPNGLVICLDNCHYVPTITRGVVSISRLVDTGFIQSFTDHRVSVSKNNVLYLALLRVMDYALESATRILNMVPTKKVDKTPYELWILKGNNGSLWEGGELEEIQDEDTSPFENTSKIPMDVEGFKPHHEEEAPVRRSVRTHQAPERLCLNVEVEEHSLEDLNEPGNYKAAMIDLKSNKWLDAMNAEMQSMKDNQV
ncbi:hypothetical protein Tco_0766726, partial [Tanacetum coccineum]